jgi:hypothetical protein
VPSLEKLCCQWVQCSGIVLEHFAARIDNNVRLVWRAGLPIVLERIVRKVVEDFEREEVTRARDVLVPVKN